MIRRGLVRHRKRSEGLLSLLTHDFGPRVFNWCDCVFDLDFPHLFEKWLWIPVHILVIQYELGSSCTVLSLVFYGQGYDETITNMILIGLAR